MTDEAVEVENPAGQPTPELVAWLEERQALEVHLAGLRATEQAWAAACTRDKASLDAATAAVQSVEAELAQHEKGRP